MSTKLINVKTKKSYDSAKYEIWFRSEIQKYYDKIDLNGRISYLDFYKTCCFFFTMTFSTHLVHREKLRLGLMNHDHSVEFDTFHFLYNRICREIFGSNFQRVKFLNKLPLAIVFIDVPAVQTSGTESNIHIHAIWVWHPEEVGRFNNYRSSFRYRLRLLNSLVADQVVFDQLDYNRAMQAQPGAYIAKHFVNQRTNGTGSEDFRIYPNFNYGSKHYAASHLYKPFSRVLYRMQLDISKSNGLRADCEG